MSKMKLEIKGFSCLAVDMGAGSIRIMQGKIENGSIGYTEIHRAKNSIQIINGQDHWDIAGLFQEIVYGVNKAIECYGNNIQSIGVDSWGVDFAMLDDNGNLLDTPIAYRDSRTEGMMELWKKEMPAQETFERTGINFYIFNTLFQILSMRDSEILKHTKKILFIPSYISYLLSGIAKNEQTIASTSQMLKLNGLDWDEKIFEKLRIKKDLFGEVIPPGEVIGPVINEKIAKSSIQTIAVAGHDTACAFAAIPSEESNFAFISTGTWCIIGQESTKAILSEKAFNLGFTNERGYNNTFRVLKNIVGLWLIQGLKKEFPEDTGFEHLEELVNNTNQTDQFIDPDNPMFFNPKNMKTTFDKFFKLTNQTIPKNIGEYLKIAYDSLCFSFRENLEFLEKQNNKKFDTIHVIGGGCQSDYFNQHIATICRKKVFAGPVEGAVLGNIIIQAISMGHIESLENGRKLVKESLPIMEYEPENNKNKIETVYQNYLDYKHKQ